MGTEIVCDIKQCKYNFDVHCTKGEVVIHMTAISGLARYPTCISFCEESSQQVDSADPIKLTDNRESEGELGFRFPRFPRV